MATLTGSTIASSYDQLLCLPSGGGNTTTLVALTDGNAANTFCLQLATTSALIVDDAKLYFGTGSDASFEYDEDGNDVLLYDGANFRIEDDTQLQFGAAADWTVEYDEDGDDDLVFTGSDMAIESSTTAKPLVLIKNTTDDQVGAELRFVATQGGTNGVDNDVAGTISFYSNDDGTPTNQKFAQMVCKATDVTSGGEEGSLSFGVAEYDGTVTDGLVLTGQPADGEVDVTIGAGASSTTTIAGDLAVTGSLPTAAKGWVKLQEVNANTTTVVVGSTSLFSTTYDMYMITASNIHTDDDAPDIKVRFILAEAVVDGSHYRSIANRLYSSSTDLVNDNDDDDKAYVAQGVGNATGESSDFQMFMHSPDGTSNHKSFYSIGVSSADNGQTYMNLNAGKYHSAEGSTLDGMHFFLSSGDFASGTFTLYGLAK